MTFLECRHSLVLCPGMRGPRRRRGVDRWFAAGWARTRERTARKPARHERPAASRAARMRGALASPPGRHAGTHMHAGARPRAGTFSKGVAEPASGRLRREAPGPQAWRRVVVAEGVRRKSRRGTHGNDDVADPSGVHSFEPGRRGARRAAEAKSTQVGLTVSGHQGPDNNYLALRAAVRQWGANRVSRVRRPQDFGVRNAAPQAGKTG